tara:strand:- start:107 stop:310 length:204 start_codon:yes stop_codon:yes gene_type:complete
LVAKKSDVRLFCLQLTSDSIFVSDEINAHIGLAITGFATPFPKKGIYKKVAYASIYVMENFWPVRKL